MYWPYFVIFGKTLLETQCLNFLADSSLLDYIREWKPFSLMNMVWSVHDFFIFISLSTPSDYQTPWDFLLIINVSQNSLSCVSITKYLSHFYTLESYIVFHQHKLLIQESIHCYCTPFQWKLLYCYFLKSIFVIKIHFWLLHRMAKEPLKLWSPNTIYL